MPTQGRLAARRSETIPQRAQTAGRQVRLSPRAAVENILGRRREQSLPMTSGPRISCSFCVVEGGAPAYMTFWKGLLCSISFLGGMCVLVVAEKLMLSVEVV